MTKLLDSSRIIPVVCEQFGMKPAALLHGERTASVVLARWCCYHFMVKYSHASLKEIAHTLQTCHSTVIDARQVIARSLAGQRPEPRRGNGPTNAAIRDAVTQCEAAILKHFPELGGEAPEDDIIDADWKDVTPAGAKT